MSKTIKFENRTTKTLKTNQGVIYPGGEWKMFTPLAEKLVKTEHPFLNEIIKTGAYVLWTHRELVIAAYNSYMLIHIYEEYVELICISTEEEFRRQGSGSNCMKLLIKVADLTNTTIKIGVELMNTDATFCFPAHPIIVMGRKKKKRMTLKALKKWFEKFGFEKDNSPKVASGYAMIRKTIKK